MMEEALMGIYGTMVNLVPEEDLPRQILGKSAQISLVAASPGANKRQASGSSVGCRVRIGYVLP